MGRIFTFLTLSIWFSILCDAITPHITVLDMKGNTKNDSSIAIKFSSSVTFICKANGVKKSIFSWKKSSLYSETFEPVVPNQLVVISNEDGESKLMLISVTFDESGIYRCGTDLYSTDVNLHVHGFVRFISDTIVSETKSKYIHGMKVLRNIPKISHYPKILCEWNVGINAINLVSVRWSGDGYKQYPHMFDVTEEKDAEKGVVSSSLTLKISNNNIRQAYFGDYTCNFNILPGATESEILQFTIPPVIMTSTSANTVYEGDNFNVTCTIVAFPKVDPGNIEWQRNNVPIRAEGDDIFIDGFEHEGRISFGKESTHHDTLQFTKLKTEDRAVYTCMVKTSLGNDTNGIFLRVKSAKSTFWPLIGIVLEVVFLIGIILIYERKRRLMKAKAESATTNDFQEPTVKPNFQDSGLRHR